MSSINLVRRDRNTRAFAAGDLIFDEGDAANSMYSLEEGEVEICKGGRVLETIETGGIFGEMGLVSGKPRGASARAKTDSRVVELNQSDFYFLVQHAPAFALDVMRVLSDRVRRNIES